uniref:Poly(A) polymerase catalytic subunit domain-containing protein n=1 Tax=viral metagenome TaxID=1070528 RepID=A0A6C0JGP3_9ZZZZ
MGDDTATINRIAEEQLEKLEEKAAEDPNIKKSIVIVEAFLKSHPVLCYGGTAINNLLDEKDRFYDFTRETPDYDFYSKTPQVHAMEIADKLHAAGIPDIQVKPGVHLGTFKVFADYTGVADVSEMSPQLFDRLWDEGYEEEGIHYVTPNFLRMSTYLELSRPEGDVSRWNKVYKRMMLLNDKYPLKCIKEDEPVEEALTAERKKGVIKILKSEEIVLLGFNAVARHSGKTRWTTPVTFLAERETIEKLTHGQKTYVTAADAIMPECTEVKESDGTVYRFYETRACHSYHETADGIKVASIPTVLQFYFAYMYSGVDEDTVQHILCVAQRVMELAHHAQKRRFKLLTPTDCLGKQEDLHGMLREKTKLYSELSKNRNSTEFLTNFFSYAPGTDKEKKTTLRKQLKGLTRKKQ